MQTASAHRHRPYRRALIGIALVLAIVAGAVAMRLGGKWQRTLANVDAMIVTPVALSTATARSTPSRSPTLAAPSAEPATMTPAPTSIPVLTVPINILLLGADTRPGIAA